MIRVMRTSPVEPFNGTAHVRFEGDREPEEIGDVEVTIEPGECDGNLLPKLAVVCLKGLDVLRTHRVVCITDQRTDRVLVKGDIRQRKPLDDGDGTELTIERWR